MSAFADAAMLPLPDADEAAASLFDDTPPLIFRLPTAAIAAATL